ncbi:hypothetical protein GALMADRAFT_1105672 [Galerina marginata CBS 339.88]|uniref:Uncharacterized protein n=1 Tax=Galerina marginata (strain CBS 339.88) TaxID=685588 RepID=A0A067TP62_GALM3|nr:hypothetical protein GALMADRAFT_1105672 [Galerina marginata CBS 339.88]
MTRFLSSIQYSYLGLPRSNFTPSLAWSCKSPTYQTAVGIFTVLSAYTSRCYRVAMSFSAPHTGFPSSQWSDSYAKGFMFASGSYLFFRRLAFAAADASEMRKVAQRLTAFGDGELSFLLCLTQYGLSSSPAAFKVPASTPHDLENKNKASKYSKGSL